MSFLSTQFVQSYASRTVEWGFPSGPNFLGEMVYRRTYRRGRERWHTTLERGVEGAFEFIERHHVENGIPFDIDYYRPLAEDMYERFFSFKALPPGRGLWLMGTDFVRTRGAAGLNNCFDYETEILTRDGVRKIGDVAGTTQHVLVRGGVWVEAPIRSFGKQPIWVLTITNQYGYARTIRTTKDHRWFARGPHSSGYAEVLTHKLTPGYSYLESPCDHMNWRVEDVEEAGEEAEVYCATVPEHGCFTLACGIVTGNCAFVSTKDLATELSLAFRFLMDMSMLGVGVGFDTRGANTIRWEPRGDRAPTWQITDDREGWVESTCQIIDWGLGKGSRPSYDYSAIRPANTPIKGFGGTASGPDPLIQLHESLYELIGRRKGELVSVRDIVDIGNLEGVCVVAGNVRRCLPKGTLVHTDKGLVHIEDVKPGMMARTSSGFSRIGELVEQGVQKVWGIRTQMGEFRCTEKHLMAVMTAPGKYDWTRANELKPGDRLVFVEDGVDGEHTELPSWSYERPEHSTTCKDIVIPPLDAESSWFLGMFHGNGYTRPNFEENGFNAYVSVSVDARNEAIIRRCQKGMTRFGVSLCDVLPCEEDKSHKIRSQSKQLAWYLAKFKTANESIEVPECVLRGTRAVRAAYVAGLYDADGSTDDRPVCLVSSVYPDYLSQVQAVYASLGIPTRVESRRPACGNWKELFVLTCVGERAIARLEDVVTPHSSKWKGRSTKTKRSSNDYGFPASMVDVPYGRNWSPGNRQMTVATYGRCGGDIEGLVPVEVLEIIPDVDEVETYDITVPEAKEFVCQEGLLVHNTAEIVFGDPDDPEYLDLKNYEKNPDRAEFGWTSNNTVFARVGMNYTNCARRTGVNGEPGYGWLENMRAYSRMKDAPDWKDEKADGGNPCLEQTLESFELCNLVENFPHHHDSLEDFRRSLRASWLYAKAVTLGMTHWERTNEIIRRNRRVGCSMSGIVQALSRRGEAEFRRWCDRGYETIQEADAAVSRAWNVNPSIKTTSVKPSGSISLLAGATPGCHWPTMTTYIRRIRYAHDHPDVASLREAGYRIEPSIIGYKDYATKSGPIYDPRTVVAEIPVDVSSFGVPQERDVPLRKKVELAALLQEEYADNQVSCTASFLPHEAPQIAPLLSEFDRKLKGISFLPIRDEAYYPQMPYESISRVRCELLTQELGIIEWSDEDTHMEEEKGCDGTACEIKAAA